MAEEPPSIPPHVEPPRPLFSHEYGPTGDVPIPSPSDIIQRCKPEANCKHFLYKFEGRVFHIKYGQFVPWNEVIAQVFASKGLAQIGSDVQVPTVHHAFCIGATVWIVMDQIKGKTIEQLVEFSQRSEKARNSKRKRKAKRPEEQVNNAEIIRTLAGSVGHALLELARVPLPPQNNLRPAAVDGGKIRHYIFREGIYRHYRNASEVERHLNDMLSCRLSRCRNTDTRVTGLADEPLVLCQGDPHFSNFIKDSDGRLWMIDLAEVDIVPKSFVTFLLDAYCDSSALIRELGEETFTDYPSGTNSRALSYATNLFITANTASNTLGEMAEGGDRATQQEIERTIAPQLAI